MLVKRSFLIASIFLLPLQTIQSEELGSASEVKEELSISDSRQLVPMPDQTRKLMREEMMGHLSTLNEIYSLLAENNLKDAANIAESRMGKSSMGKHRSSGMGPGRFMPIEMRNIGWGMHDAATEFSLIAKQGDLKSAYSALQKVTNSCVACHYSYRTQ